MSQYSKVPEIHETLSNIPYIISWTEVITTYPSLSHLPWIIFFALFSALIQLTVYLIFKPIIRRIIGYNKYPPLPNLGNKVAHSTYYLKLGAHVKYKRHIKIHKYDIEKLSEQYCDSQISPSDITRWFVKCNEYHAYNRVQRVKFREYLFPIIAKSISLYFGLYAVYDQEWLYDRSSFYRGWPNQQKLDCCIPDIKLLYFYHMGYCIHRFFSGIFIDRHLKDFVPTLIHHIASLTLLILSYWTGFLRIGTAVLLLHDPADIVLQSAKLFKLLQIEILCNFFFALLCVTWFSTRIVIFPYHCIFSAWRDFWIVVPDYDDNAALTVNIGIGLMSILYILHLHWFKLLINAVIRIINGGDVQDGRSDNEDDTKQHKNDSKTD